MKTIYKFAIMILISGIIFFEIGFYAGKQSSQMEYEKYEQDKADQIKLKEEQLITSSKKELDDKRNKLCTEKAAEENFKYWMEFNYPDWKIMGKVSVISAGDCSFNIRFTTRNPHFSFNKEKEVIVVQLQYSDEFDSFNVRTLRGLLY